MNIKYKNYFLEQVGDRFDLYKIQIGIKGKSKGKEKQYIIGYGFRLESAVKQIVALELESNQETTDLKTWITEYKKQSELITKQLEL